MPGPSHLSRSIYWPHSPVKQSASIPDSLVQPGNQLDECLVEVPADRASHLRSKVVSRAPQYVSFPGVQGRLQCPCEPAHTMNVSKELLVCHVGMCGIPHVGFRPP